MFETYPKSGKKQKVKTSVSPANYPDKAERIGNIYRARPALNDSDEEQMRRRMSYYGKKAPVQPPEHGGFRVDPRRTMIRE